MKPGLKFYFDKLNSFPEIIKKPSIFVIIFGACFAFFFLDFWTPYNAAKHGNNFAWDVYGYYSYLPATFCNEGSFDFKDITPDFNINGPFKNRLPKYTYGMSVMYSPFFALGYKIAYNSKEPLHGFSDPFTICVRWGSIFYVLLGMFFLRKFLLIYFNEVVTALTIFVCVFGSMLFIYTYNQSEMSHGYLFCLFSIFLFLNYKWHLDPVPKFKYTFLIGFVMGLIALIRPTEIFIVLLFLLWNIKTMADFKHKFNFFLKNYIHVLIIILIGIGIWIPQCLFWKQHTGTYFYFSYQQERFFWNDPQILNILFSYRKGWITYTPLIAMAFVGFFFVKKDFPLSKWTFIFVTALMVYVLSCWWDWTYGGCFGAREFCQQIAYLSIPLAFFINFIFYSEKRSFFKRLMSFVTAVFLLACVCLNLNQSNQYQNAIIHPYAMTKEAYWYVFNKYKFEDNYFEKHI